MSSKSIKCKSRANVVATTTATWNIAEWCGPFQSMVREEAVCFVTLKTSATETMDLRFYFRYEESQHDPHGDRTKPLCEDNKKFSGYTLMMDVLSDHNEKLMISVAAEMPDNDGYDTDKRAIVLEPSSKKRGLTVIKAIWPCETWSEKFGVVDNYEIVEDINDSDISASDATFVLTVSSHRMINTGPDNPKLKQYKSSKENTPVFEPAQKYGASQLEPDNYSDLKLVSKDGIKIRAHRFILAARSPYFCRLLKSGTTSVSLDVNSRPLLALLHWIYTGEFADNFDSDLESIIEAGLDLEMPSFLEMLDNQLINFANPGNMLKLAEFAKTCGLKKAAEDLADFMQCNLSTWLDQTTQGHNLENETKALVNDKTSSVSNPQHAKRIQSCFFSSEKYNDASIAMQDQKSSVSTTETSINLTSEIPTKTEITQAETNGSQNMQNTQREYTIVELNESAEELNKLKKLVQQLESVFSSLRNKLRIL